MRSDGADYVQNDLKRLKKYKSRPTSEIHDESKKAKRRSSNNGDCRSKNRLLDGRDDEYGSKKVENRKGMRTSESGDEDGEARETRYLMTTVIPKQEKAMNLHEVTKNVSQLFSGKRSCSGDSKRSKTGAFGLTMAGSRYEISRRLVDLGRWLEKRPRSAGFWATCPHLVR
ncbi:hypothetical protein ACLOJK_009880 [Asimina triloba]